MGVPLGTPSAVRILRCERGVMSDKPRHLCDKTRSQRLCVSVLVVAVGVGFD